VSEEEWRVLEDITSTVDQPDQDDDDQPEAISVRNVFQMLTALEQAALAMQVIDNFSDEEIAGHLKWVRSGESRKRSEILAIGDPQGAATFAGLVLVKRFFAKCSGCEGC
jgi:hypothetical protein